MNPRDYYLKGQFNRAEQALLESKTSTGVLTRLGELALWKNQVSQAEKYLLQATENASWLEAMFPMNIQRNSLLAMTYYRQDKFPEAAHYFNKAAGAIPLPFLSDLRALEKHLTLMGDASPYLVEGSQSTSIPFVTTDPLPVVEMSVNDSDPMLFIIDTGGAELILDTAIAQQFGAEFDGILSGGGGGSKGHIQTGKVNRVQLGSMIVHHVPIHGIDTASIAAGFDMPIKGIIGTRFLMHFLATIDYPRACLTLRPKDTKLQSQKAIPFYLVQTHYILVEASINDSEPMLFFVDTGLAGQGFSIDKNSLNEHGIQVDWSQATTGTAGFGASRSTSAKAKKLSLGTGINQVSAEDLSGIIFEKPFEVLGYRLGFYIGGVVSHLFFRDYALSLDFVAMQLLLDKS